MEPASELTNIPLLPARLPKGTELAGYVVDGWLRDGGMAAIYRAHRASDGARMALKLQLPSTTRNPEICQRFDREAEAMRRVVGEPNVVELHHFDVLDDGRRYFVMEWVEGDNLEELLDALRNDDKRLSVPDVCELGLDVARGLAAMHDHGLVHRDLKPSNVMVGRGEGDDLLVKLVDFGIVADLRAEPSNARAVPDESVMGTSAYMAPEQVAGHPPTPAVDVFALGVVLYEALTGSCVPPDGWTPETLPTIDSLRRNVPPELVALVRACMSSAPEQRPASGAVVVARLEAIVQPLQAAGPRTRSSEEVPIRTGGTMLTPRTQVAAVTEAPPVRTGGTEVSLTHEQVLTMSGSVRLAMVAPMAPDPAASMSMAVPSGTSRPSAGVTSVVSIPTVGPVPVPAQAPVPASMRSSESSIEVRSAVQWDGPDEAKPPARRWGLVLGVLVLLGAAGALWAVTRSGDEGSSSEVTTTAGTSPQPMKAAPPDAPQEAAEPIPQAPPAEPPEPAAEERVPTTPDDEAAPPSPRDQAKAVKAPSEQSEPIAPVPPAPTDAPAKERPRGPDKAACDKRRSDATAAKMRRDWSGVLKATSLAACWTGAAQKLDRRRLRVEAHAETGSYALCVKEGGGNTDSQIGARVKWCTKKLGS